MPAEAARAAELLESIYGPADAASFPEPFPPGEAALCADGHQRRYLWTDAFAVLAYMSLADACFRDGDGAKATVYTRAANALIDTVHRCLGVPRSHRSDDAMLRDPESPTGYVGLRIGKADTRKVTDAGMQYDGMYFHYIDKWCFALARAGRVEDGVRIAKSVFPYFFDGAHGGIRWKLSIDATPPPEMQHAFPNDDTLTALIVFSVLEKARERRADVSSIPSLGREIHALRAALDGYRGRVTDDPLGWGLAALFDAFVRHHPRSPALKRCASAALHPRHLTLPFRLYGALIGALVAGERVAHGADVRALLHAAEVHEARWGAKDSGHTAINRVMLAVGLLCPGVLAWGKLDPLVELDSVERRAG